MDHTRNASDDVSAVASWVKDADLPPERAAAALLLLRLAGVDVDVDDASDDVQALFSAALASG